MNTRKRMPLTSGPQHSSSSIEIRDDGTLLVEFYDFSDEAEKWFGNDVAYLLIVSAGEKNKIAALLKKQTTLKEDARDRDEMLLRLMQERFGSYFEVKEWFTENGIEYKKEFNSWA